MNWPCKKLEELVLGGKIAHGGHPVLRWMAGNVSIEKDASHSSARVGESRSLPSIPKPIWAAASATRKTSTPSTS